MVFETDNKYIKHVSSGRLHQRGEVFVEEIVRPIEVETSESLEENLYKHKARGQRFVVVPSDDKYYDVKENSTKVLDEKMVLGRYVGLITAIQRLDQYEFLLVDMEDNSYFYIFDKEESNTSSLDVMNDEPEEKLTYDEFQSKYPNVAEEYRNSTSTEKRFGIITLSEVNQRQVKETLYPIIAEFERSIASKIKDEYSVSRELADIVGRDARRTWKENKDTGSEVHIAEFMNLTDMRKIISDSELLARNCGFKVDDPVPDSEPVKNIDDLRAYEVETVFSEITELRNKVMHANRALVQDREGLQAVCFQLQLIMAFLSEISEEIQISWQ